MEFKNSLTYKVGKCNCFFSFNHRKGKKKKENLNIQIFTKLQLNGKNKSKRNYKIYFKASEMVYIAAIKLLQLDKWLGRKKLKVWLFHRRPDKSKLPLIKCKEKGIFYKELCIQLWAKAKWYQIGQELIMFFRVLYFQKPYVSC